MSLHKGWNTSGDSHGPGQQFHISVASGGLPPATRATNLDEPLPSADERPRRAL